MAEKFVVDLEWNLRELHKGQQKILRDMAKLRARVSRDEAREQRKEDRDNWSALVKLLKDEANLKRRAREKEARDIKQEETKRERQREQRNRAVSRRIASERSRATRAEARRRRDAGGGIRFGDDWTPEEIPGKRPRQRPGFFRNRVVPFGLGVAAGAWWRGRQTAAAALDPLYRIRSSMEAQIGLGSPRSALGYAGLLAPSVGRSEAAQVGIKNRNEARRRRYQRMGFSQREALDLSGASAREAGIFDPEPMMNLMRNRALSAGQAGSLLGSFRYGGTRGAAGMDRQSKQAMASAIKGGLEQGRFFKWAQQVTDLIGRLGSVLPGGVTGQAHRIMSMYGGSRYAGLRDLRGAREAATDVERTANLARPGAENLEALMLVGAREVGIPEAIRRLESRKPKWTRMLFQNAKRHYVAANWRLRSWGYGTADMAQAKLDSKITTGLPMGKVPKNLATASEMAVEAARAANPNFDPTIAKKLENEALGAARNMARFKDFWDRLKAKVVGAVTSILGRGEEWTRPTKPLRSPKRGVPLSEARTDIDAQIRRAEAELRGSKEAAAIQKKYPELTKQGRALADLATRNKNVPGIAMYTDEAARRLAEEAKRRGVVLPPGMTAAQVFGQTANAPMAAAMKVGAARMMRKGFAGKGVVTPHAEQFGKEWAGLSTQPDKTKEVIEDLMARNRKLTKELGEAAAAMKAAAAAMEKAAKGLGARR